MINQNIILAILLLNITITFGIWGYLIHGNNGLSNKIAKLESKLNEHLEWHRERDQQKI